MITANGIFRITSALAMVAMLGGVLSAQDSCGCYQVVPQTIYRPQTVTTYRLVDETSYETQQQTSYKPVWVTEHRERKYTVRKPIQETSERIEEYTVLKPVVEKSYTEKTYQETYLEEETELRDQEYVVEKPITETSYREQSYIVRKPVIETVNSTEQVTVFRPTTTVETQYSVGTTYTNQLAMQPQGYTVPRLSWDPRSQYVDPYTGAIVTQRGGLQWTRYLRPPTYAVQTVPQTTCIPQQVATTSFIPETVTVQKPVQVTRYVEEVVTSRIPVTTQTVQRQVVTQKVPVTVQRPRTRIVTEKVPVETVRYVPQTETRKVPVTQIHYEVTEHVEPYDVQVLKYIPEIKEIQIPKTVTRRVPQTTTQLVPETQWMRLPIDSSRLVEPTYSSDPQTSYSVPLVVDPSQYTATGQVISGIPVIESKPLSETSVVVPKKDDEKAQTPMIDVERPPAPSSVDARSGNDSVDKKTEPKAAEKPPSGEPAPAESKKEADTQPNLNNG